MSTCPYPILCVGVGLGSGLGLGDSFECVASLQGLNWGTHTHTHTSHMHGVSMCKLHLALCHRDKVWERPGAELAGGCERGSGGGD